MDVAASYSVCDVDHPGRRRDACNDTVDHTDELVVVTKVRKKRDRLVHTNRLLTTDGTESGDTVPVMCVATSRTLQEEP